MRDRETETCGDLQEAAEQRNAELTAERDFMRAVLDTTAAFVVVIDTGGRVVRVNRTVLERTGYSEEELLGHGLSEMLLPPEERPAVEAVLRDVLDGRFPNEYENHWIAKDGSRILLHWTNTALKEDGSIRFVVSSGLDVTADRQREAERERLVAQLEAVSVITSTAVSTLDLQQMLDSVMREIVDTLGASAATVLLLEDREELVARASVGLEAEVREGFRLRIGDGFGGTVAKERRPLHSREVTEDVSIRSPYLAQHGIRSLLGVPLLSPGEELVGVLRVGWSEPHPFDQREVELLQLAADRFALAIVNARLYQSQEDIADTLQASILTMPERVKGVDFGCTYQSATEAARVGGDFYDVFDLPGDRVGIAIGDVSGKGLAAAALTAITKTTLKAYALEYESPAQVMRRTNELLLRESDIAVFVTAFLGVLDVGTGRFVHCNAGHPPPIVCHADRCSEELAEPQPFLGAFPRIDYEHAETRLNEGDMLLLYTDGVLEARNPSGEFYGQERLTEALWRVVGYPVDDVPRKIYQDVLGFAGGKLTDDIALLAVRVTLAL